MNSNFISEVGAGRRKWVFIVAIDRLLLLYLFRLKLGINSTFTVFSCTLIRAADFDLQISFQKFCVKKIIAKKSPYIYPIIVSTKTITLILFL